jgi:DNA primase
MNLDRPSIIDELTARQILTLAGHLAPAERKPMRCIFHAEKRPSLSILDRGYRCFSCGAHGGLLDLAIAVGFGYDHQSAAQELEERLHG